MAAGAAVGVAAALGMAGAALAETYAVTPYPGHTAVAVGTNGSSANGIVAVSDSGTATGECIFDAGGFLGCLAGPGLAVSGAGTATGGWAVSGTGDTSAQGMGWGVPAVSVSGTGCARSGHPTGISDGVAVSATGCATGTSHPYYGGHPVAVSGTNESRGSTAVSGTGNAHGGPSTTWGPMGPRIDSPGVAVSGTGNAYGGAVTVAGTDASGSGVTVARGAASANGGTAAVGGGDAEAYGGVAAVSLTGNAQGAVVNVGLGTYLCLVTGTC